MMKSAVIPSAGRFPRRVLVAWCVTAALVLLGVAAKAAFAGWYRHQRQALSAQGRLPSQIVGRANAALGHHGAQLGQTWPQVRQKVLFLGPYRIDPTPPSGDPSHLFVSYGDVVAYGNVGRRGWNEQLEFDRGGRLTVWRSTYSDDEVMEAANAYGRGLARLCAVAGEASGALAAAGVVTAVIVWRQRPLIAGYTLAAAVVGCVALHISVFPDQTFLTIGREPIHWAAPIPVLAAASLAFWPVRKIDHSQCVRCRYDLTGNVSGVCPECGTAVVSATSAAA